MATNLSILSKYDPTQDEGFSLGKDLGGSVARIGRVVKPLVGAFQAAGKREKIDNLIQLYNNRANQKTMGDSVALKAQLARLQAEVRAFEVEDGALAEGRAKSNQYDLESKQRAAQPSPVTATPAYRTENRVMRPEER